MGKRTALYTDKTLSIVDTRSDGDEEKYTIHKRNDKSVAHDFGQWSRGDLTRRRRRVRYQTRTRMQHAHGIKWRRLQLADDDNIYNKRDWISVFTSHLAITSS